MPKRQPLTMNELKAAFRGTFRKSDGAAVAEDARANAALGRVNQQQIIDECDGDCLVEEWDRQSPINGKSAFEVLRFREDIPPPPAKVYLIKRASDGHVIFFQPFKPRVQGFQAMTDQAEFDAISEEHRSQVANDRAVAAIKNAFVAELDKE